VGAAPRAVLSTVDAPARLIAKYGTEAAQVAALDPTPVTADLQITAGEVKWAVQQEGALDADDVLHRRTRIGLVPANLDAARANVTELVEAALAEPVTTN
jgi:glycerol-3-phosphate dehydrogenase